MKTISITTGAEESAPGKRGFSRFIPRVNPISLATFVLVLLAVLIGSYLVLGPRLSLDNAADTRRKQDMQRVYDLISLYILDKGGILPTYDNGIELPKVTSETILEDGADVDTLSDLGDVKLPKDPTGVSYKIGVLPTGRVGIAIRLSNGDMYLIAEPAKSITRTSNSTISTSTTSAEADE
jgi:hypothetical protein